MSGTTLAALPFPDDSFDLVVSLFAFPLYVEGEAEVDARFSKESVVSRHGGKTKLAPPFTVGLRTSRAGRRKRIARDGDNLRTRICPYGSDCCGTKQGLRETVLEDVSYGASPDAFDRILTNLPPCYRSIINRTTVPDVGPGVPVHAGN